MNSEPDLLKKPEHMMLHDWLLYSVPVHEVAWMYNCRRLHECLMFYQIMEYEYITADWMYCLTKISDTHLL